MNYQYTTSGFVRVGGCSGYKLIEFVYYNFAIGSIVYSKPKAINGVYEKIIIKNVRFPKQYFNVKFKSTCRICNLTPLYIDTLNAYWNEEELVSYNDAKELIDDYYEYKKAQMEDLAMRCK